MANESEKAVPAEGSTKVPTFSGNQLIHAARGITRDILTAALVPDQHYTEAEAKSITKKFLKKEVSHNGRRELDNSK
jgi:hypothetical protein